jgi:hypothetical protein
MEENNNISLALQYLLLNQALFKKEISQITEIPMKILNAILEEKSIKLNMRKEAKLMTLYQRLKLYDNQVDDYLT